MIGLQKRLTGRIRGQGRRPARRNNISSHRLRFIFYPPLPE
nr:hypothetical protein [Escherichia coli]